MVLLMDYDRVRWLQEQTTAAASGMDTTPSEADPSSLLAAYVPAAAFGNTGAGLGCGAAWDEVVAQARTGNENMRLTLDLDVTRLDEVIALFQSADHESADAICAVAPSSSITVMSAHLHSHDDPLPVVGGQNPSRAWDDYLRATQHDRMVDYATGRSGSAIVGVDANVSIDRDADGELAEYGDGPLAPAAVERFEDEGFQNVGDWSDGLPGEGTSSSDRSIDYVWSRGGLSAGPAQRVEGDPSDHDGQRVDYRLSDW